MIFFFFLSHKKEQDFIANLNVWVIPRFDVLPTIYFNTALGNYLGLRMKVILVVPELLARQNGREFIIGWVCLGYNPHLDVCRLYLIEMTVLRV